MSKRFRAVQALQDVSVEFRAGEIHALVGQNGAGKSTLVKILVGLQPPDSGTIRLDQRETRFHDPADAHKQGIIAVHQERSIFPDLTITENLFPGRLTTSPLINWRTAHQRASELLHRFNVDYPPTTRVGLLPVSVQQIIEIIRGLSQNPRLLMLDEPTASLVNAERETLFELMRELRNQGVTIIIVEHNLGHIFEIADRLTVLRDGKLVQTTAIKDTSRREVIYWMTGKHVTDQHTESDPASAGSSPLLEVKDLVVEPFNTSVSFNIYPHEIVGLAGLMGSGASDIVRAIGGADWNRKGTIRLREQTIYPASTRKALDHKIAYLPPDRRRQGLFFNLRLTDNVIASSLKKFARATILSDSLAKQSAIESIETLDIRPPKPDIHVQKMSGGNQQKVVFGRILQTNPDILVLDSPTVGVDVGAQNEIYKLCRELASQGRGILITSNDFRELSLLCTRIMVVRHGKIVKTMQGTIKESELIYHIEQEGVQSDVSTATT